MDTKFAEWKWRKEWCDKRGYSPYDSFFWGLSGEAYQEHIKKERK